MESEYEYTCTNRGCSCLKTGIGLYFVTDDLAQAEKHSKDNNSPMWISKKGGYDDLDGE